MFSVLDAILGRLERRHSTILRKMGDPRGVLIFEKSLIVRPPGPPCPFQEGFWSETCVCEGTIHDVDGLRTRFPKVQDAFGTDFGGSPG